MLRIMDRWVDSRLPKNSERRLSVVGPPEHPCRVSLLINVCVDDRTLQELVSASCIQGHTSVPPRVIGKCMCSRATARLPMHDR